MSDDTRDGREMKKESGYCRDKRVMKDANSSIL